MPPIIVLKIPNYLNILHFSSRWINIFKSRIYSKSQHNQYIFTRISVINIKIGHSQPRFKNVIFILKAMPFQPVYFLNKVMLIEVNIFSQMHFIL